MTPTQAQTLREAYDGYVKSMPELVSAVPGYRRGFARAALTARGHHA